MKFAVLDATPARLACTNGLKLLGIEPTSSSGSRRSSKEHQLYICEPASARCIVMLPLLIIKITYRSSKEHQLYICESASTRCIVMLPLLIIEIPYRTNRTIKKLSFHTKFLIPARTTGRNAHIPRRKAPSAIERRQSERNTPARTQTQSQFRSRINATFFTRSSCAARI